MLEIKDKGLIELLQLKDKLKLTCEFDTEANCESCKVKLTKQNIGLQKGDKYYCDNPGCTIKS